MDDNHDHGEETHTMNCPVCAAPINVHAHDDEEAVNMLMMAGKQHFEQVGHPSDQSMSREMEKMTREQMRRV